MRHTTAQAIPKCRRRSRLAPSVPWVLVVFRFLIGPLLYCDIATGTRSSSVFLLGFTAAWLSDLFDGVIARRLGVVTARLREADGHTDVWFYGWIAACVWLRYPTVVIAYRVPLLLVIATQVLAWVLDWHKYRRFSNYHTYSARAWGIALFIATSALFSFDKTGILLWPAIVCGFICTLEEIAITRVLPRWTYDVPSVLHARRLYAAERSQVLVDGDSSREMV